MTMRLHVRYFCVCVVCGRLRWSRVTLVILKENCTWTTDFDLIKNNFLSHIAQTQRKCALHNPSFVFSPEFNSHLLRLCCRCLPSTIPTWVNVVRLDDVTTAQSADWTMRPICEAMLDQTSRARIDARCATSWLSEMSRPSSLLSWCLPEVFIRSGVARRVFSPQPVF